MRHGDRRGRRRELQGGNKIPAFGQSDAQRPVEYIAGGRRIHDLDAAGRNPNTLRHIFQQRSQRPHRNHHILHTGGQQNIGSPFGILPTLDRDTGQQLAFGAIRSNQVQLAHQLRGEFRRRRRIEDYFCTFGYGHFSSILDGSDRHFQLHEYIFRLADSFPHSVNVVPAQSAVGPRSDHDTILAFTVHGNQRCSRGSLFIDEHEVGIQIVLRIVFERLLAKQILAHASHKSRTSAQPGRSDSLIGALAPGGHHENATQHGFAGFRDTLCFNDQVRIGTAYYYDFFHFIYEVNYDFQIEKYFSKLLSQITQTLVQIRKKRASNQEHNRKQGIRNRKVYGFCCWDMTTLSSILKSAERAKRGNEQLKTENPGESQSHEAGQVQNRFMV